MDVRPNSILLRKPSSFDKSGQRQTESGTTHSEFCESFRVRAIFGQRVSIPFYPQVQPQREMFFHRVSRLAGHI